MTQIELIEAVAQKKSLESRLARLTEIFAKQIRRELQTRQIDYLQSLSELQELHTAIEKRKMLAVTTITAALEQMRFRLVKADIELRLLETTLKRTEGTRRKTYLSTKGTYYAAGGTQKRTKRTERCETAIPDPRCQRTDVRKDP